MTIRRHQIMNCQRGLQSVRLLVCAGILLFLGCAPEQPLRNRDAMLPEVDVLQLKENGDVALKLAQQCRASLDNIELRLSELERNMALLQSQVQAIPLAQMEEMQNQLTVQREELTLLRQAIAEKSATVPTFNPTYKAKVPEVESPAPDDYRKGIGYFQNKSYSEAIASLDLVTVKDCDSKWADDAWYWIGESYLALGDYNRALSAYQKVFTFAGSDKADDAQYKVGYCFFKMGDRKNAVAEYQKVEVLFPESEYVPKARAELHKLQSQ